MRILAHPLGPDIKFITNLLFVRPVSYPARPIPGNINGITETYEDTHLTYRILRNDYVDVTET